MSRIRLLGVVVAGLLIGIAVATADARVKQRYEDIYRSHLSIVDSAGRNLTRTLNLEDVTLGNMSEMCRSPYASVRKMARQLAERGASTNQQRLKDIQPGPMGKWFEDDRWYTKPGADRKVVARGLKRYRQGIKYVKNGFFWVASAYERLARGKCAITLWQHNISGRHRGAVEETSAGIELLRSLLH